MGLLERCHRRQEATGRQPFNRLQALLRCVYRFEFPAEDGTVVVFREPLDSDAKPMMRFINSVIRETESGIIMDRPVSLKQEEAWLKARMGEIRRRSEILLVAEIDGRIVGNCQVVRRQWKERHRADVGIVLSRNARGKGIGRAIMTESINMAIRRMPGLELFELSVFGYNRAARALYKSLGFVESFRMHDAAMEGDEYVDELVMTLRIRDWTGSATRKACRAIRK